MGVNASTVRFWMDLCMRTAIISKRASGAQGIPIAIPIAISDTSILYYTLLYVLLERRLPERILTL